MIQLKIGFIGTGVMGGSMALNLIRGGCEVAVYNRSPQKTLPLAEAGAVVMSSVSALASWSDVVITIVGYPKDFTV